MLSVLILVGYLLVFPNLGKSEVSLSLEKDKVTSVIGKVVRAMGEKENRKGSYQIKLYAIRDDRGNLFSSSGLLYISSDFPSAHYGDIVEAEGTFYESIFSANFSDIIRENPFGNIRKKTLAFLDRRFGFDKQGYLSALLLTGRSKGRVEAEEKAKLSGLSFLFALSGMHLGIIYSLFSPPFLKKRKIFSLIAFSLMVFISYISGWRFSLTRALIFRLLSALIPRDISFYLSFLILVLMFPASFSDLGAAFSFISLSGLFLFSPHFEEILSYIPFFNPKIKKSVASSISALIFSSPVTYFTFSSYQIFSVFSSFFPSCVVTLYLSFTILSVFFPFLKTVLRVLYFILDKYLSLVSLLPPQTDMVLLVIFILSSFMLLIFNFVLKNKDSIKEKAVKIVKAVLLIKSATGTKSNRKTF